MQWFGFQKLCSFLTPLLQPHIANVSRDTRSRNWVYWKEVDTTWKSTRYVPTGPYVGVPPLRWWRGAKPHGQRTELGWNGNRTTPPEHLSG